MSDGVCGVSGVAKSLELPWTKLTEFYLLAFRFGCSVSLNAVWMQFSPVSQAPSISESGSVSKVLTRKSGMPKCWL
jgi:hypothetical protein